MTTWVPITRAELEGWLDKLPLKGNWRLQPGRAGVYLLPLSDVAAIKLSSTIGSDNDAMGRGEASMQLALVSLVTGQVLNKKAQGQARFHRTVNWKKTWKEGFDRFADVYLKSQGFYDAIASIKDREQWTKDTLAVIETVPDWQSHSVLHSFHRRVQEGGVLTTSQQALLQKLLNDSRRRKLPEPPDAELLERLRTLWKKAKEEKDFQLMRFVADAGKQLKEGHPPDPGQKRILDEILSRHKVARRWIRRLAG